MMEIRKKGMKTKQKQKKTPQNTEKKNPKQNKTSFFLNFKARSLDLIFSFLLFFCNSIPEILSLLRFAGLNQKTVSPNLQD